MKPDNPSPLPPTEQTNPRSRDLDRLGTLEMLQVMNAEDAQVTGAVRACLPQIAQAVDEIAARLQRGGRLIYTGAGTSGRLGVLDASECPPTFGVEPELVMGFIAGGDTALRTSVEGAEDDPDQGRRDLQAIRLNENDCVVGLSASGSAPSVLGALRHARQAGALCIGVACVSPAALSEQAHISILAVTGPEVLSGSTRLKAGTAQKMILNMLSTGVMVRLGKTCGNLMVNVQVSNAKLRKRAIRLVTQICGIGEEQAQTLLIDCGWQVKTAVAAYHLHSTPDEARAALEAAGGQLRKVIEKGD
jgi:N-acetylmuramic acid 6-phosphate etherase